MESEANLRIRAYGGDYPPEDREAAFEELERREEERAERAERREREEADEAFSRWLGSFRWKQ